MKHGKSACAVVLVLYFFPKDRACALLKVCKSKPHHAIAFGLLFIFSVLSLSLSLLVFLFLCVLRWSGFFSVVGKAPC